MRSLLKYSVSALALTIGLSAANAQNMDEKRQPQGQEMQQPDADSGNKGKVEKRGEANDKRGSNDAVQGKPDGDRKERVGQSDERKDNTQRSESRDRKDDGKQADQMQQKDSRDGDRAAQSDGKKSRKVVKNVQITKEKKTVIRDRFVNHAPKRYKRNEINFNLSVGTSVPSTYVIYDVPSTFFEIVPEYQGYDYIVVGDVLLIIDPDTREIVDVIDV